MAEENGKDEKVDLGQLTEALKGLPDGVQKAVKDAIKEASGEQRTAAIAAAAAKAKEQEDLDILNDNEDNVDLESLSRNEFANHINKGIEKAIAKALKPVQDKLETTSTEAETDRVKGEFQKAKKDYPDFMEWGEEMRDIITAHPDLHAEDIYRLARAKNPEKAKEIDDKAKEEKGEDERSLDERSTDLVKAKAFGGLKPTSGKELQKDGKKQPKEAAESAWEEVMGQVTDEVLGQALEG